MRYIRPTGDSTLLAVDLGELAGDVNTGDSIAVSGVCLTVTEIHGALASFDVSSETLENSTLGRLRPSSQVNIERAIRAADRFGGHFVQGHVDGTATIVSVDKHGKYADFTFAADAGLLENMVAKGSVAVDGISLTLANIDQNGFKIAIIPETLRRTTLSSARTGDLVNVETDIIVKTIKRQLENILPKIEPLTAERLKQLGF